jgi:hypothetical protein
MESAFASFLSKLSKRQAFWYGLTLDPSDSNSLARLLGIEYTVYLDLMVNVGFLRRHGDTVRVEKKTIETFIDSRLGWSGFLELTKSRYNKKNQFFLRIGRYGSKKGSTASTPSEQFVQKRIAPPRPRAVLQKLFDKIEVDDDIEPNKKQRIHPERAVQVWRRLKTNIPPKVHCIDCHACQMFILLGGLGDFSEQFVERRHQIGKKDNWRSQGMRDRFRKFDCHSIWEEQRLNPAVKAATAEVKKRRTRNMTATESKGAKNKRTKLENKTEIRNTAINSFDGKKTVRSTREVVLAEALLDNTATNTAT